MGVTHHSFIHIALTASSDSPKAGKEMVVAKQHTAVLDKTEKGALICRKIRRANILLPSHYPKIFIPLTPSLRGHSSSFESSLRSFPSLNGGQWARMFLGFMF